LKKIILAGGTGFLGKQLAENFEQTHEVVILTRIRNQSGKFRYVFWDGENSGDWEQELEGTELVINFSGKSINCLFNSGNKALLLSSRIKPTHAIAQAISRCKKPPEVWINISGAGYYGDTGENIATEVTQKGAGFLSELSYKWEQASKVVLPRLAVVLGNKGGAYLNFRKICRAGLAGKAGTGNQYFSWIHISDFIRATEYVISNKQISGPVNFSSPEPIRNKYFMQVLRESLNVSVGLPAPSFVLEIGKYFSQTEPELVLSSSRVYPEKLINSGFVFRYPEIKQALNNLA
jgi:uncharacterized protein